MAIFMRIKINGVNKIKKNLKWNDKNRKRNEGQSKIYNKCW